MNFLFKKIKKVYIAKFLKSKRLRDDIPCSTVQCKFCETKSIPILTLERNIIILDSCLIIEQIDALENFEIINNCVIPQSEYMYVKEKDNKLISRINNIIDNRNIYLFPNEYHQNIVVPEEEKLKKKTRKNKMFTKTIEYFLSHYEGLSDSFKIVVLTNSENKNVYANEIQDPRLKLLTLSEFALEELKENPDLYNYISHSEEVSYKNQSEMQIDTTFNTNSHLNENEMKSLIKQGKLFQGKIYFLPGILDSAKVRISLFEKEIIINTCEKLNRATHGDIVCVEMLPENEWLSVSKSKSLISDEVLEDADNDLEGGIEVPLEIQRNLKLLIDSSSKQPIGKIRGILRRNREQFCGTIYNSNDKDNVSLNDIHLNIQNYSIFIPIDSKYPNFLIRLFQPEKYYNKRILVKFDSWIQGNPIPSAHFIKNLGDVGDIKVENDVILYEHNVDINPFSQRILNSMPKEDTELKVEDDELKKRMDLRNICVCSIDPPGCKDIDDALHCRKLDNGNFEIGVHIADVTHYVRPGSEVDRIAAKNSNTVYMVHKRTDMLPKVLTENLCSLVGGRERLAFSVLWEIDAVSLEILKVNYTKSVIKSKAALTYQQANDKMNDKNDKSELAESIRNLNRIAKHLKNKRLNDGALILASNEMKFIVDFQTNSINDISQYQTYETNSLVEEYMLLANVYVADKIYKSYPSCAVLRRHPPPKDKEIKSLKKLLEQFNFEINITDSKSLGETLDKLKRENDKFFNKLVRVMITRTMNQAKYFGSSEVGYEDFFHYGLAMPIYTHFTSPIRRYADVLVHRLLAAAIDIDYLPLEMSNKLKTLRQCDQMNKQNRVAFFCSKDSNDFSTYMYFDNKKIQMEVVIFGVDSNFIKGTSVDYGIEADINFTNIESVDVDYKQIVLKSDEKLNIFDHILVEVHTMMVNYRRKITYNFIKKIN